MRRITICLMICLVSIRVSAQDTTLNKFFKFFIINEYDSARAFLEKKLEDDPNNPQFRFYLGKTHLALKRPSNAIQELQKAIENKPSDAKTYDYIGRAYEEQGMLAEAIDAYRSSIQWNPLIPSTQLKLASLYYKQHDYATSIFTLRNFLSKDSTIIQAYYLLGRSYIKKAEYDSTISVASKAVTLDSTSLPNILNLGIAFYNKKKYDDAAETLEKAVELSTKSDEARYYLGQTYISTDQRSNAVNQLERCASLNGSYKIKALKSLVVYYYQIGLHLECMRTAERYFSLKTDEYLSLVHYFLARVLSDEQRFLEADLEFEESLKLSNVPFINSTYLFKGLNFYYQKKFPQAIKLYKKALTIDPNFSFALYNLAIAYDEYYEDKQPAISSYEKFLTQFENNEELAGMIQATRKRLSELKEKMFFSEKK